MLGRALPHQFPAFLRQLDDETAAVGGRDGPRHQPLVFQRAQQGADGVLGDIAGLAQLGGRDARLAHLLGHEEMQQDAPARAGEILVLHPGLEHGVIAGGAELDQPREFRAADILDAEGCDNVFDAMGVRIVHCVVAGIEVVEMTPKVSGIRQKAFVLAQFSNTSNYTP